LQEFKKLKMLPEGGKKHHNRACGMSDSEIITVLLLFHFGSFKNFKHCYLHFICVHLKKDFPEPLNIVFCSGDVLSEYRLFWQMYRHYLCRLHQKLPFATTNASNAIKFLKALQKPKKVQWTGSMASNSIRYATTRVNCSPFASRPQMRMTGTRKYLKR
jgi:hypothetical protein